MPRATAGPRGHGFRRPGAVRRTRGAPGQWGCRPLLASPGNRCCWCCRIRFPCALGPPADCQAGRVSPHRGQVGGGSSPMNSPQPGQTSWSQHTGSPTTSRSTGGAGGTGQGTGGLGGSAGTGSASAGVLPAALTAVASQGGWSVMSMSLLRPILPGCCAAAGTFRPRRVHGVVGDRVMICWARRSSRAAAARSGWPAVPP